MKILTLCMSKDLGGLELYALRSALALSKDHEVVFVTAKGGRLDNKLHELKLQTFYLNPAFRPLPLLSAYRLARIIDREKIDIVHMHWGKDLALASLAKRLSRRKPKLVYTRQMMITREKKDIYHRFLYAQLDLMLTITRQLEELCKRYLPGEHIRIQTLYYGVNPPDRFLDQNEVQQLRQEKGFAADDFVVGLFGRLEEGKGQYLLISALAEARARNKRLKALIVGHEMLPGYRQQLKDMAETAQIDGQIVFNDFVDNPQQLMQICDCICLTTYEETFGLVLPEAMRAGVAVVGSNRGGVPEIIDHGKTGLLFESRDADDLCRQLCLLHDQPALKAELATAGRQKADAQFDSAQHFAQLEKIFTDVS
ncbi:MAG TPA: glycosyltransferase family 1 protein [Gammaproteobacteria bacterium]|nr:glycosyltransferase family 1 protein [Gammaproteobacteria bacterium]